MERTEAVVHATCAMRGAERDQTGQAAFDLRGLVEKMRAGAAEAAPTLLDRDFSGVLRH